VLTSDSVEVGARATPNRVKYRWGGEIGRQLVVSVFNRKCHLKQRYTFPTVILDQSCHCE